MRSRGDRKEPSAERSAQLALSSLLISINWTIYIYCVTSHQLIDASLGLLSDAAGFDCAGRDTARRESFALAPSGDAALATAAVGVQAFALGHIPWVAPALALTFGFYGYVRKLTPVDALDGLTIETWILFPITLFLVSFWRVTGTGAFPSPHLSTNLLLILGGPLTAIPLSAFAAGARRIRLSHAGFSAISLALNYAVIGDIRLRREIHACRCNHVRLRVGRAGIDRSGRADISR